VTATRTPVANRNPSPGTGLLLILLVGLFLRLWGLTWSLPESGRLSYHPDEVLQVGSALRIDVASLQLNPHFYNYGAMYSYLVSAAMSIASALGLANPGSLAGWYIIARLLTAFLGAAIPYLVYLTAVRLYDRRIAMIAAAVAAIAPIAVVHSHFATVDAPATFWVAACLASSSAIARGGRLRWYALAGLTAGFAGATKYGAAVVIVAAVAAYLLRDQDRPWSRSLLTGRMGLLLGAAAVGFIVGNPGCVLWPAEFAKGFMYEYAHVRQGHGLVFEQTGSGWLFHLTSSLRYGMGVPLLILALAGLCVMVIQRRGPAPNVSGQGRFLIIFALVYYLIIGFARVRFARYIIPLTPVLSIAVAIAIVSGFDLVSRLSQAKLRLAACAALALLYLGAAYYTISYSIALDRLFTLPDPRVRAAEWIERRVPKGSVIAFPTVPWFYSPALRPEFTALLSAERFAAMSKVTNYRLVTDEQTPWDWSLLRASGAQYAIVSDFEDLDALRARDPNAQEYMRVVCGEYARVRVFENRLRAGGLDFGPSERLPHDLKYASPRITIYRRRA